MRTQLWANAPRPRSHGGSRGVLQGRQRGGVAHGIAEGLERRHLHIVRTFGVIGARAAMMDVGAGRAKAAPTAWDQICGRLRPEPKFKLTPDRIFPSPAKFFQSGETQLCRTHA